MLARPLHVALLCEALLSYYKQWLVADESMRNEIDKRAPWHDQVFYRTKLYQLVVMQQFRKYLIEQVQIQSANYSESDQYVAMFTQVHQLRLRELAFKEIFHQSPIQLIHYLDYKLLDRELYNLGLINKAEEIEAEEETKGTHSCFSHRIFQEYFAAQYLLAGLIRSEQDFYYQSIAQLIAETHANPRYEQVWQILGEMIRYGDVFLNFKAYRKDTDVFTVMKQLNDNDLITAKYRFFRNCLNGQSYACSINTKKISSKNWFIEEETVEVVEEEEEIQQTNPNSYAKKSQNELLKLAKQSKNAALPIIKFLLEKNELTNGWLYYFFWDVNFESFEEIDFEGVDSQIKSELSSLKSILENCKWPEHAWGGYWDIDVYLPAVGLMKEKLFTMFAAYFIHRIENRKKIYYNAHIPFNAILALKDLAKTKVAENPIFFMMIQSWLRLPYILNQQESYPIIPTLVQNICHVFKNDKTYRWLAVDTLFALGFVFRFAIVIQKQRGKNCLVVQIPCVEKNKFVYEVTAKETLYFLMRMEYLRAKSDFNTMTLPDIEWNGLEFEEEFAQQSKTKSPSALIAKFDSPTHTKSSGQKANPENTDSPSP